ncbi:TPA: hypothetical protein HA251_03125 [Candidatus Woesearchaeota archaeon]|nr:hypothetical protein [Candidatus Woesearchaeota archaeon]
MDASIRRRVIIALATAGVLFSGYLSAQWTRGACDGGCSILLGLPTCAYGFVMFSIILIGSLLGTRRPIAETLARYTAVLGVLFSLWFGAQEMMPPNDPFGYWLILPNCAYGLVVYAAVVFFAFSGGAASSSVRAAHKPRARRRNV